jgi:hypothetical protein
MPRHQLNFNGGLFYAGLRPQLNARYAGSSFDRGSGLPAAPTCSSATCSRSASVSSPTSTSDQADRGRAAAQEHRGDLRREQPVRHAAAIVDDSRHRAAALPALSGRPTGRFSQIEIRKLF